MHRNRTGRKSVGRGLILMVSAFTIVVLATASPAAAAGTLDQSFEPMPDSGSIDITPVVGQTFTSGITGTLDQVDLGLSRGTRSDASATIEIRTTVDGLPTDTVLASASVPTASIPMEPAFVPIPIGPVPVTTDTKYAIVITGQGFHFHGAYDGGYPRGGAVARLDTGAWREDPSDFAFHTYVTEPPQEPPCRLLRLSLAPLLPITICL